MAMSARQVEFSTLLRNLSKWTATTLWEAHIHNTSITETTITQHILLEVQKEATYVTLSTANENQTGADWQWTIKSLAGQSTKVLCQAKILDTNKGSYPKLDYKVGGLGGPQQVDVLLNYAQQQNAEAFYVLYNYTLYDERVTEPDDENNGCFIVKATDMKRQIDKFIISPYVDTTSFSWNEIKQYAIPLSRLFRYA
jgi:hypothetical protein